MHFVSSFMHVRSRISNIDFIRGIVMIIMALDHTRDFVHDQAFTGDPLDLETTTPLLFFTRWITHLCAPTFVFLSGTSIYLQGLRKSKNELSSFLIKRGLWLVLLEVTIITLGITFNINFSVIILQVIWAIGISMFFLGFIIRLPFYAILSLGVIIVAGHNLLDSYEATHAGDFPLWYKLLHRQGVVELAPGRMLMVFYPFLAWTGVMILGYCFGKFYLSDVLNRHRRTAILGASLLLFFVILRALNIYGDPLKWSAQDNALYTFFSFINTQKYPPSLLFLSVTIGISLILLGVAGDVKNKVTEAIEVYGRVPLFYYVVHFYLVHAIGAALFLSRGHSLKEGIEGREDVPLNFIFPGEGYSLGIVYLVWIIVVVLLYPLCKWYMEYKATHRHWWLSYL